MGAYDGTAEASKSYFGKPLCETIVAGDINGDCKVDFSDFAILAAHWLQPGSTINSNSAVKDGIAYYMQTDKPRYHQGDNGRMVYTVRNLGTESVLFRFNDQVQHYFEVTSSGKVIWFVPKFGEPLESSFVLGPNDFKEYSTVWNMIDENGTPFVPSDDLPAIPGTYKATGSLHPISLSPEDQDKYVPVSVQIQVVP